MSKIRSEGFCLANLGDGDAERQFSEELERVLDSHRSGRVAKRDYTIKIEVGVSFLDDNDDSFIASIRKCQANMPARKAIGRIVRIEGGAPVVDIEETDADGNRSLFVTKGGK